MKIAIYARVSKREQAEDREALERQLWQLRRVAKETGDWIEFIDVQSGLRDDRPQFEKMIREVKTGRIGRIIITRIDRITRNLEMNAYLVRLFEQIGTEIYETLLGRVLETKRNPQDWDYFVRSGVKAEGESRMLSARIKQTFDWNRERGKPLGGNLAFGYRRNAKGFAEPDPNDWDKAAQVVEIFIETNGGTKETQIRIREELGIDRTAQWIYLWIRNPFLRGHTTYDTRDRRGYAKRVGEPITILEDTHPSLFSHPRLQLIDAETKIRYLVESNRRKRGKSRTTTDYPVSGLIWCGRCGAVCHIRLCQSSKHPTNRYIYVWCSDRNAKGKPCGGKYGVQGQKGLGLSTRYEKIDAAVLTALADRGEELAKLALNQTKDIPDYSETPAIQELRLTISKLDAMNDPDLADAIAVKRANLNRLILDTQSLTPSDELTRLLIAYSVIPEFWQSSTDLEKKTLYREFVERIEIAGDSIVVKLRV